MTLYDFAPSHNCYKARLLFALLGITYDRQPVDLMAGVNRTAEFLRLNPRGQVPVLEDNGLVVWDSTAILVYVAKKYGGTKWFPDEPDGMARVVQWLALAQNDLLHGIGRAHWIRRGGTGDLEEVTRRGQRGLRILDLQLSSRTWLAVDCLTIADIACYPHAALAPEAGISLDDYTNVKRWCGDVERTSGYVDIRGNQ
jgi:glutathione S-transferase